MPLTEREREQLEEKAKQWIEQSTPDMLDRIKSGPPPVHVRDCRRDPVWAKVLRLYAKNTLVIENVDFLDAVDTFKQQRTMASAQEIYGTFVREDAPSQVNLPDDKRKAVTGWFEPNPGDDIFKDAYEEVRLGEDPARDEAFRNAVDYWRQARGDVTQAVAILNDHVR